MFFGEFEHTIDSKGRLTIPAKFRDTLAGGIVVTRGLDGCLWAFARDEWQKISQQIAELSIANTQARRFTRFMFANAFEAVPDRNGRIVIPGKLMDHAEINTDVVVTGMMNRLELWNPAKWAEEQANISEDPESLAAQLAELGII